MTGGNKLTNSHLYIQALFHAMLSEQEDWKIITDGIDKYHKDVNNFYQIEDDTDRAYILDIPTTLIIAISGTKSKKGWVRNFLCWQDDGWHYGFRRSFKTFLCEPVLLALNNFAGKKIYIFGHSAGGAIGLNAAYFIKDTLKKHCELVAYCSPQAVNRKGKNQCKKAKVYATFIDVGWRDQVDNIVKLVGGKDYGYQVTLPDVGKPKIDKPGPFDDPFLGHAPSYVCKSLKKLFISWGDIQRLDIIDEISRYAVL